MLLCKLNTPEAISFIYQSMKRNIKILLVDDDEISSFIVKKILAKTDYSYELNHRVNGQLALDYINERILNEESLPDVIFIDINMPILDGWNFLKGYLELNLNQPVVKYMLTSSFAEEDLKKFELFKSDLDGYITKPITREQLIQILDTIIKEKLNP